MTSSNYCLLTYIQIYQEAGGLVPDVQAGFRKGSGTRDQIANICWIMEKAREFSDCVDHNKLWKILKEMGITDTLPAS